MRYPLSCAVVSIGCVLALPVLADPAATSVTVMSPPTRDATTAPVQSVTRTTQPVWVVPHDFRLFGMPVRLSAPVLAPYDNSSFRTIGGQPATGADAQMVPDR